MTAPTRKARPSREERAGRTPKSETYRLIDTGLSISEIQFEADLLLPLRELDLRLAEL